MESYLKTVAGCQKRAIWDRRPSLVPFKSHDKGGDPIHPPFILGHPWEQAGDHFKGTKATQSGACWGLLSASVLDKAPVSPEWLTKHNRLGVCQSDIFRWHNLAATVCQGYKEIIAESRDNQRSAQGIAGAWEHPFLPLPMKLRELVQPNPTH